MQLLLVIIILSTVMISSSDAYYQSCRCLGDGKNNQTSCDQAIDDSIKGSGASFCSKILSPTKPVVHSLGQPFAGQLIFRRIQPPITSVAFNVSFIGSLAFILRPVPAGGEYSNNSDAYGSSCSPATLIIKRRRLLLILTAAALATVVPTFLLRWVH